jgi:death-on-curing family protein
MVIRINEEIIIIVHDYVVHKLIADEGIIYFGTISEIVDKVFYRKYGGQKYGDTQDKAGAILYSIAHGHSFEDGNKRTGLLTTCLFLLYNGFVLHVPHNSGEFLDDIADVKCFNAPTEKDAISWLKKNTKRSLVWLIGYILLTYNCKVRGIGKIKKLTHFMLERNLIPYIDKEKLLDKKLWLNRKKRIGQIT